jgi:hypothetical protein
MYAKSNELGGGGELNLSNMSSYARYNGSIGFGR